MAESTNITLFNVVHVQTQPSGKAILCEIAGKRYMVPVSQIHESSTMWKSGSTGSLVVAQWWAIKNRLLRPDGEKTRP